MLFKSERNRNKIKPTPKLLASMGFYQFSSEVPIFSYGELKQTKLSILVGGL